MNIVEIINKKRVKEELTRNELEFAFNGYLNGNVCDYQMSSLLMAICINDMTDMEIFDLVDIFIKSGDVLDLSGIPGIKVDKHSTGGIGDKITLIIGPIVASCGVSVPKMSGRGLGYTGGTIDKLESIKGFRTSLDEDEFIKQVQDIGFAVTGQTSNLCPLDKVIYALRDVTGTVESIPLIASSIMSKKIAGGADKILIDIKCGVGATLQDLESALKLKDLMERIGDHYGKLTICEISDMNTPLGSNVGNSLEVIEAMDVLKGKKGSLTDLAIKISSEMVSASKEISFNEARREVLKVLENGLAYNKFLEFVKYQGGDINTLLVSEYKQEIKSNKDGIVKNINALNIGKLSCSLGAGRLNKEDSIDHTVGIILNKLVGDRVLVGDTLFTLYKKNNELVNLNLDDYYEIN
ncbi:MAG: thymidine phosphorylase [Bacilli bacterium]|nr:thymidine phosphorylase [Bacilli bacterium]